VLSGAVAVVIVIPAEPSSKDAQLSVIEDAFRALAVHVPGPDSWCAGCLDQWAGIASTACPDARDWLRMVETNGVVVWDFVAGREASDRRWCAGCNGRGWKYVVSRCAVLWNEGPAHLIRRSCIDCDATTPP
jgi:hypothetical protein